MAARTYPPENSPQWVLASSRRAIGEDSRCHLLAGSRRTRDEYGVWNLMRRWQCRTDLAPRFEPRDGDRDFLHPELVVWDWEVTHGDNWESTIEIKYNGLPESGPGRKRMKPSAIRLRTQTFTQLDGTRPITMTYYCPTVTWLWASRNDPRQVALGVDRVPGSIVIETITGSTGIDLNAGSTRALENVLRQAYGIKERVIRSGMEVDEDGCIFRVAETQEKLLVQESAFLVLSE